MLHKFLPSLSGAVLVLGLGLTNASAAPLGPVSASAFHTDTGLNESDFTYIGTSTSDFSAAGTGTLTLTSASYYDTVGLTTAPGANPAQSEPLFTTSSTVGSTVNIDPSFDPFAFYFTSGGSGGYGSGADAPVTLYSDGFGNSNDGGQANLAIYLDSTTHTYALFFDDGGPSGTTHGDPNDDNDYNDLVVTYQQTPTSATPEPSSIALLGTGLLGVAGMLRKRLV